MRLDSFQYWKWGGFSGRGRCLQEEIGFVYQISTEKTIKIHIPYSEFVAIQFVRSTILHYKYKDPWHGVSIKINDSEHS